MSNDIYKTKSVDELTFTDDGMFQAVLHQENICTEIVERLLHIKISKIEYPELEKQIAPFYTTKGVRLDVYLKDENRIIDIEIQCYRQLALGKRTRYYQSMIDIDSLMKGQPYPTLKESYILFICKQDPFKTGKKDEKGNDEYYGLPCYTFRNICEENPLVNLNDKSVKVIYNASAYEEEKDKKIHDFLRYVLTDDAGEDDFTKRLAVIVKKLKDDEKFRSDYAAMNLHDWDLTRMAKESGAHENAIKNAINALKMNLTVEQVSKITGLSQEEIQKLKQELVVELSD